MAGKWEREAVRLKPNRGPGIKRINYNLKNIFYDRIT